MKKPLSELAGYAREALDSMDDFARMDAGVDARGPRGVLEQFIADAEALARRVEGADSVRVIGTGYGAGWGDLRYSGTTKVEVGQRVALVPVEGGA